MSSSSSRDGPQKRPRRTRGDILKQERIPFLECPVCQKSYFGNGMEQNMRRHITKQHGKEELVKHNFPHGLYRKQFKKNITHSWRNRNGLRPLSPGSAVADRLNVASNSGLNQRETATAVLSEEARQASAPNVRVMSAPERENENVNYTSAPEREHIVLARNSGAQAPFQSAPSVPEKGRVVLTRNSGAQARYEAGLLPSRQHACLENSIIQSDPSLPECLLMEQAAGQMPGSCYGVPAQMWPFGSMVQRVTPGPSQAPLTTQTPGIRLAAPYGFGSQTIWDSWTSVPRYFADAHCSAPNSVGNCREVPAFYMGSPYLVPGQSVVPEAPTYERYQAASRGPLSHSAGAVFGPPQIQEQSVFSENRREQVLQLPPSDSNRPAVGLMLPPEVLAWRQLQSLESEDDDVRPKESVQSEEADAAGESEQSHSRRIPFTVFSGNMDRVELSLDLQLKKSD